MQPSNQSVCLEHQARTSNVSLTTRDAEVERKLRNFNKTILPNWAPENREGDLLFL